MSWEIGDILDGNVGFFWPQKDHRVSVQSDPEQGYLQQSDRVIEVKTLEKDPFVRFRASETSGDLRPYAVVGATEKTGVILADITGTTSSMVMGTAASVNRFRGRILICGVGIYDIKSTRFNEIQVFFPGMSRWFGVETSEVSTKKNRQGRLKEINIRLRSRAPKIVPLEDGLKLSISNYWSVSGAADSRNVFAPVSVGIKSRKRLDAIDLIRPIFKIQNLFSMAYRGFVGADGGLVTPHHRSEFGDDYKLWASPIMETPKHVAANDSFSEVPLFTLAQIGGAAAVMRWLDLHDTHPRIVGPVVDPYRSGPSSIESKILTSGAAIDYWFGIHKKVDGWRTTAHQPLAVINSLPRGFEKIVIDVEKWSKDFWEHYNGIKHNIPAFKTDLKGTYLMAESATLLLLLVAVNEISSHPKVINDICESHRLSGLRDHFRDYYN